MPNKIRAVLFLAMLVTSTSAGLAYVPARAPVDPSNSFREIRPGFWVGPYQCIDVDRGPRDCSSN